MAPAFLPSDGGAARLLRAAMFSSGERGRGRTKWNSSPADSGRPESTRAHFSLHESGAVIAVAAAGNRRAAGGFRECVTGLGRGPEREGGAEHRLRGLRRAGSEIRLCPPHAAPSSGNARSRLL